MGLVQDFESRLEKIVEGFFSRAFPSAIQPAEIGHRLMREMQSDRTVSLDSVYVPNKYEVGLAAVDYERLQSLLPTLSKEFGDLLRRQAAEKGWSFPGVVSVEFQGNNELAAGRFAVSSLHSPGEKPQYSASMAAIHFDNGTPPLELSKDIILIGRLKQADISLNDPGVSRRHAEINRRDDGWWIIDRGSTNGTLVNGTLVRERRLASGDRIKVGAFELEFRTSQIA